MKKTLLRLLGAVATGGALIATAPAALAQDIIKIGVVGPFTGPFAVSGQSYRQGVDAYMALNGHQAGGRKVEVLYRDSAGADPTLSKRLAEELVVKDKVSMLLGFYLSPEVAASAPVANAAKTPLFIVNAATPALMKMSPFFVRMGQAINQPAELAAAYSRQQGKSRGYVAVGDYAPGHIVEQSFIDKFKSEGGEIVGNVRIPLNTADFAPIAERIANANPDVLQIFIPPGAASVAFSKALAARGLTKKVLIIGQGEAEDSDLPLFDDSIVGFNSIIYIDANAKNAENVAFADWLKKNAGATVKPNSFSIGAFDAMHLAYKMLNDQKGKPFDGEVAMKSMPGFTWKSPRGSITVDPVTREPIQNFYLREVVKGADGVKSNRVVKTWEQVKPTPLK
ncbi:branched-chain amino acid transport system substrate-binding protein [Acidovorax sp. 100]|uniref:ABC transporter substrate-binding protein n=1 Tax=Acidovorax sp. 100 TaxID=2135635 RepID=UPI000EF994C0|nr:ABC transporter substrate-binding protein [Acidovorax sp. 100]RMA59942.1 branched-chain amino acid transport system substrate-binding protein [Acidovorax sp. 100]